MKAIIDLAPAGTVFDTVAAQLKCATSRGSAAGRNYSNVHCDVTALEALGLVRRDNDNWVFVPFESVEIQLRLAKVA